MATVGKENGRAQMLATRRRIEKCTFTPELVPGNQGMVQTHNTMMIHTYSRPSVPGSQKTEGAKNHRVTDLSISTYNVITLREDSKVVELE